MEECKNNQAKRRKGSNRLEDNGMSMEELHRQQLRLIEEAKQQQLKEEQEQYQTLPFNNINMRPVSFSIKSKLTVKICVFWRIIKIMKRILLNHNF